MGKRFSYSIPAMTRRLLKIAGPVKGTLWVSTLASIVGNLSQMGLMGFGALLLLSCAGMVGGPPWVYALFLGLSALCIVLGRYIEGWSPTRGPTGFWPACGCICMGPSGSWRQPA